jgi:hypothetical protein
MVTPHHGSAARGTEVHTELYPFPTSALEAEECEKNVDSLKENNFQLSLTEVFPVRYKAVVGHTHTHTNLQHFFNWDQYETCNTQSHC